MSVVSRHRGLSWVVAFVLLLGTVWSVRSDEARAGGAPPIDGVIDVVYVAVGTNFPDSLGTGPGAGVNGAPIIILPTNPPIPPASAAELTRLDPRKVIIVGGTAVISPAMEAALAALLPDAEIGRIAGANRYETNAMFSESVYPIESWVSISAPAFTADQPSSDVVLITGPAAYESPGGSLMASIQLPHGAQILELKADLFDNSASDMAVSLHRSSHSAIETVMILVSTGTGGDDTRTSTAVDPTRAIVDNENYGYWITVFNTGSGGAELRAIRRVMVRYRLGEPGA